MSLGKTPAIMQGKADSFDLTGFREIVQIFEELALTIEPFWPRFGGGVYSLWILARFWLDARRPLS